MTDYYEVEKKTLREPGPGEFCIATAAVWSCELCRGMIDGMGGPGDGELCTECGEAIKAGYGAIRKRLGLTP